MKRFRFPLKPVAVLRAHRETLAREAFGAAVTAFVRAEAELATIRGRIAQFEAALEGVRQAAFSALEQAQLLDGYRRERAIEAKAERSLSEARQHMDKKRAEYLEAHRQVEIVKRLEQRARSAHARELLREEQAELDDFASRRASADKPFAA